MSCISWKSRHEPSDSGYSGDAALDELEALSIELIAFYSADLMSE